MTDNRVENSSGRAARKLRLALMGPAFIAAIGYIDLVTSRPIFRPAPALATSYSGWWSGRT